LNIHEYLEEYSFQFLLIMECSFKFRDIHSDIQMNIHQINSRHHAYSREYLFLLLNISDCFTLLLISHLAWILICAFQQWQALISIHLSF